jgi:hypothetical protein
VAPQIRLGSAVPQCLEIAWAALDAFYSVSTEYDPINKSVAISDLDSSAGLLRAFFAVRGNGVPAHAACMWCLCGRCASTFPPPRGCATDVCVCVCVRPWARVVRRAGPQDLARYKARVVDAVAALAATSIAPLTEDAINGLVVEDGMAHITQVEIRLKFLKNVMSHSGLRLTYDQVSTLWTALFVQGVSVKEKEALHKLLTDAAAKGASGKVFDFEVAERLYTTYMVAEGLEVADTTMSGFKCLEAYLIYVNTEGQLLARSSDTEFSVLGSPFAVRGLGFLWRLVLEAETPAVAEAAVSLLTRLHYNVSPTSSQDLVAVLREFLGQCMATVEKSMRQKRWRACGGCLMVIDKLLTLSDSRGSGSLRPHSSRGRGKAVTLVISNNIPTGPKKFEVRAYANSTIWEVRAAVAKHCKVAPERVRMYRGSELTDAMNSTTLASAKFRLQDSVMTSLRPLVTSALPPLLLDDKVMNRMFAKLLVPVENALIEIFSRYTDTGAMSMDQFRTYFFACGALEVSQTRLESIFANHETNSERHLTRKGALAHCLALFGPYPALRSCLRRPHSCCKRKGRNLHALGCSQ